MLRGPGGRPLRVAHLTTVDMSLALLLRTELRDDVDSGLRGLRHQRARAVRRRGRAARRHARAGALADPRVAARRTTCGRSRAGRRAAPAAARRPAHPQPQDRRAGPAARPRAGVPVVVNTCHGLWLRRGDRLARRVAGARRRGGGGVGLARRAVPERRGPARRCAASYPARRVAVVGNGVDLARFRPDPAARGGCGRARRRRRRAAGRRRRPPGGGEGDPRVRRGGARARRQGAVRLGRPGRRRQARRADRRRGAASSFLGSRRDMPAVYSALDVFVLPSYREGFSRSAMEAAACGLPMVLTDIRGCREIGGHGEELLLVPPRDAGCADRGGRPAADRRGAARAGSAAAAQERALREFDQRRGRAHLAGDLRRRRPPPRARLDAGGAGETRSSTSSWRCVAGVVLAPVDGRGGAAGPAAARVAGAVPAARAAGCGGREFTDREVPHHARRRYRRRAGHRPRRRGSAACCGRRASTSCRSCATCCAAT